MGKVNSEEMWKMVEYSGELFPLHSSNMCPVLETDAPQTFEAVYVFLTSSESHRVLCN